jgi:hypothetical protein
MKGLLVPAFFILFAAASLLIPVPLRTGSWFCAVIGQTVQDFVTVPSAIFNGLFYGVILWLFLIGTSRKLEE